MPASLTAAVLAGGTAGLGLTLIVRELLPTAPHLGSALDRLAPARFITASPTGPTSTGTDPAGPGAQDHASSGTGSLETRVGRWATRHLPAAALLRTPTRELNMLQIPAARWLGQKVLLGLLGLGFPALFTAMAAAMGYRLPVVLPALGGLVLGGLLFTLPDVEVRRKAVAARAEFARATSAYIDLTALERAAGTGATQSLEQAAAVGDSWVFVRLREELIRAGLSGIPPWDALHALAVELGLPELSDLADIMRLSGEEGAAVVDTLRARSRGLRAAMLTKEQAQANEDSERMVIPVALLGLIFLVILGAPAVVRIL